MFDLIQILNLLYIAVSTPVIIGFGLKYTSSLTLMEVVSLLLSAMWIVVNFRTQALVKGNYSLKFHIILKNYMNNNLYLDLLGILPFNLLIGLNKETDNNIVISSLFRSVRILSCWKSIQLITNLGNSFKNNKLTTLT